MKFKLLLLFLFLCIFAGCGDGDNFVLTTNGANSGGSNAVGGPGGAGGDTTAGGDADVDVPAREVAARVVMPSGTNQDLSGLTVMSQLYEFPVGGDGTTKVALNEGGRVLAIVFDSNDQPILAGFISDSRSEISVKTTVETSLYLGLGTFLLPAEIRQLFWDNIDTLPGVAALVSEAESLYRNDPLFLQSDEYRNLIAPFIASLAQKSPINARLVIPDTTIKSGIQLKETEGDSVTFVQSHRRRTHAFVYKMKYRLSNNQEFSPVVDSEFYNDSAVASINDFPIIQAGGATDTIGTVLSVLTGAGMDFAAKETGPVDFSLAPDEEEVNYSIRVVGPSRSVGTLTRAEKQKLLRLHLETFTLDFLIPAYFLVTNQDNDQQAVLTLVPTASEALATTMTGLLAAIPSAQESVYKGEYEQALRDVFNAISQGLVNPLLEELYKVIAEQAGTGLEAKDAERVAKKSVDLFKALKAVDSFLQVADWARIDIGQRLSNPVEDFRIRVTKNKVLLVPEHLFVMQGDRRPIKAEIQDDAATLAPGESLVYRWSTPGVHGKLRDSNGMEGTTLETPQDTIQYVANNSTPPDDAEDQVTCKVHIKGPGPDVPVGESKTPTKVAVRKRGFEIFPEDIEVDGGNVVSIGVRHTDKTNPLDSIIYDYQFVWETSGKYGRFEGASKTFSSSTSNEANYECLEYEDEGMETVTVTAYHKLKDIDGPFEFSNTVSGKIKVSNDPNKQIFYVDPERISGKSFGGYYWNGFVQTVYQIAPIDDAIKYVITVIDQVPDAIPTYIGKSTTYDEDDPPTDGFYRHLSGRSSVSTLSEESVDAWIAARLTPPKGQAKVVVTIRPPAPEPSPTP